MSLQRNCPSQDKNTTFMFWNSRGFTQVKSLGLQQIIHVKKIEAFSIVEAGAISLMTITFSNAQTTQNSTYKACRNQGKRALAF
jgi:hypothetical protein